MFIHPKAIKLYKISSQILYFPVNYTNNRHEILKTINIYLGHEHKSVFVRNGAQQVFANQKGFVNLNIMDSSIVKEIIVPSCNYRLGNTGYGAAIVSKYQSPNFIFLS